MKSLLLKLEPIIWLLFGAGLSLGTMLLTGFVLIVGAPASSNSSRLVEVATKLGVTSFLIAEANDIDPAWIEGLSCVGVSAGASTPEFLVAQVVERLCTLAGPDSQIESLPAIDEGMHFKLPDELRD